MIWAAATLVALGGMAEARLEIVRAQLDDDPRRALGIVDAQLAASPLEARSAGFSYLRGHLLERLGRLREADDAFAAALTETPELGAHSRFRLALNQTRRGHPEVAAGLLASLLARDPPESLSRPAARLLVDSLAKGGDCRLLRGAADWPLDLSIRRLLRVSSIHCGSPPGEPSDVAELVALLEEEVKDEAGRLAAERIASHGSRALLDSPRLLLVGQALHHQRRFDLAADFLERGLQAPLAPGAERGTSRLEARYSLARSHFWRASYLDAAAEFGRVAAAAEDDHDIARALYQQGRSFELEGSWNAAASSFRLAFLAEPMGRFADASLLSTLRLEWRQGNEAAALGLLEKLRSRREWARLHGKAVVFLASSDIARGRSDRAGTWLAQVKRPERDTGLLVSYWGGKLAELERNGQEAVAAYSEALADDPFGPIGEQARARLSSPELAPARAALAAKLATARDARSLYRQWLLVDPDARAEIADRLRVHYSERAAAFHAVRFVDPRDWPLWEAPLRKSEEILLSLGIWNEGAAAVPRHFPPSTPELGYTGSRLLARAGVDRQALRIAETLVEGAGLALPPPFVPVILRRASYPLPYGSLIAQEAARYRIDPFLLAALIREESRFDPRAISGAAARGLTQLTLPTAIRLAASTGMATPTPEDLYTPALSVALGSAYVAELSERFSGRRLQILAAYNAGERQAELWRSYCFGNEEDEFLSKVGFPETRHYLHRVLTSRNQYADLYPAETLSPHPSTVAEPSTRDGRSDSTSSK